MIDLDLDLDLDLNIDPDQALQSDKQLHVYKGTSALKIRKASSENKLLDAFKNEDFNDKSYFSILSQGDVDFLSFLKLMISRQKIEYCLLSTWCMAMNDVQQIKKWFESKDIMMIDAYVGEIFPNQYSQQYHELSDTIGKYSGRICVFKNHSKIFAGTGDKFSFGINSSANINTNPRTENTNIMIGSDIFKFYKDFFDGIKSYNRDFDKWEPYNLESKK